VAALLRRRPSYDFVGRTVLVTGGSRGLGLVLARAFVARGASVALMARDPQELARAVESLGPGVPAAGVVGDVRLPDSCAQTVDEVIARFGRLDVLVNNAGLILSAPLARTGVDDFEALMDVHFWGTLHMTSAA
jgi:NAD(P)-dependent dehydrogenase (short-subunit alcohol dehydrogenase family)